MLPPPTESNKFTDVLLKVVERNVGNVKYERPVEGTQEYNMNINDNDKIRS